MLDVAGGERAVVPERRSAARPHGSLCKDIELYVGGQARDGSSDIVHEHLDAIALPDAEGDSLAVHILPCLGADGDVDSDLHIHGCLPQMDWPLLLCPRSLERASRLARRLCH